MVSDDDIKKDWLQMTGKNVSHCQMRDLGILYIRYYKTYMRQKDFKRLKATWLYLTGMMNINDFYKLKRKYLTSNQWGMKSGELVILRKYSIWLSQIKKPDNWETLKLDYLILNFLQMSDYDYIRLKTNWLILTDRIGIDNQEHIIKGWLRNEISYYNEYRLMRESCKIVFTRFYLERGIDVNYYSDRNDTLLHVIVGDRMKLNAPIVEFLLSYGADVTIRARNGLTPLDEVRIFYYKDFDDITSMLQVAEKSIRRNLDRINAEIIPTFNKHILNVNQQNHTRLHSKLKQNATERLIQTFGSIYLKIMISLFKRVNLTEIGDLLLSVINFMFISNTPRIYLNLNQDTSSHDNITRIHQIYSNMCTKLFNVFDLHFSQIIDISFPPNAKLCEDAELVLSVEIHPELEWVALKLFADPSGTTDIYAITRTRYSMEYYILCMVNSRSRCILCRKYEDDTSIHTKSDNLISEYERYFSREQQRRLVQYGSNQLLFNRKI